MLPAVLVAAQIIFFVLAITGVIHWPLLVVLLPAIILAVFVGFVLVAMWADKD